MENDRSLNTSQEDVGVTMMDVLQEEEELQQSADAVLGAGDDTICNYSEGPVKRQALYACMTCCPSDKGVAAGICLGCSYHCHDGHNLIELYTKRNFQCDCGNSKFPAENPCKLSSEKSSVNADNSYNNNFIGKYCVCDKPYPDPEDTIEDSMLQCIMCEDWYHGRHLKTEILPSPNDFSEMICHLCAKKNPFLLHYSGYTVTSSEAKENIDVLNVSSDQVPEDQKPNEKQQLPSSSKMTEPACKLIATKPMKEGEALFFQEKWRNNLCSCLSCKALYSQLKVEYLLCEEDTIENYEQKGKQNSRKRTLENELDALSSLDRVTRTEMVCEYNDLSASLRDYFRSFAESGQIVSDSNIRDFFSELTARKKQKTSGMTHFCK